MTDSNTNDGDGDTQSVNTRWRFTNDVLAGLVLLTLCATVVASVHYDLTVPDRVWWVFATVALIAAVWTFGAKAVEAVKGLRA